MTNKISSLEHLINGQQESVTPGQRILIPGEGNANCCRCQKAPKCVYHVRRDFPSATFVSSLLCQHLPLLPVGGYILYICFITYVVIYQSSFVNT
jgi:hypothetical protein